MQPPSFVHDLGMVLGVAAVTGVVSRLLRQPSVVGYLFAGLIVGPYLPIPLFADPHRVHALSEFGVVLVMFAVGLEFRLGKLLSVLPISGVTGVVQMGVLMWAGFNTGVMLGFDQREALFLGVSIAISSTMVVSKVFDDVPVGSDVRELVLGVLVLQDLAAIVLITAMTAIAAGGGLSPSEIVSTLGQLALVLLALLAGGIVVVPRALRVVFRLDNAEAVVVGATGLCFAFALIAEHLGYSVALGAFIAGILVAESGRSERVEHHIRPLRDVFAAVFFVSVGMTVDPQVALESLGPSLIVYAVVVTAQLLSVSIGGLLSGNGMRRSITAGLSLGQIGEFAFILGGIGIAGGVVRPELQSILVSVAVLSAFSTPLALRFSHRLVGAVDHLTPARLQTLLCVYEGWFEKMRVERPGDTKGALSRSIRAVVIDGIALITGTGLFIAFRQELREMIVASTGLDSRQAWLVATLLPLVVLSPLVYVLIRNVRAVSQHATAAVFGEGSTAQGARILRAAIRIIAIIGIGAPAAAILRPLLDVPFISEVVLGLLCLSVFFAWRSAGSFDADLRSGAERLLSAVTPAQDRMSLAEVQGAALPGLDQVLSLQLPEGAYAVGKTLSLLDLRAQTGASVIAIGRAEHGVLIPTGSEVLKAGDRLSLAGAARAGQRARSLLLEGPSAA